MQSLSWYVNRLSRMSRAEMSHRLRAVARAGKEWLVPPARVPPPDRQRAVGDLRFLHVPANLDPQPWLRAAQRILAGRYTFFDLVDCELGNPPEWNRDPLTGHVAPLRYARALDHRDERRVGNIKYLWEPNRHLHLVTLAQAYAVTGDARFAQAVRHHVASWIEQCPFGRGPNWLSPLELAIRLINWSLAWQLLGGEAAPMFAGEDGQRFRHRWLHSIYRHVATIMVNRSSYSSANNHLIGEAAGVWIAALTWPLWPQMRRWGQEARAILEGEVELQNERDGGNREQALAYQQFVLDFLLLAGLAGRAAGQDFTLAYWIQIERMIGFIASLMDVAGNMPMIGDADDGAVVCLAADARISPYRSLVATGALLFGRADLARKAGALDARTRWLQREPDVRFQTLLARSSAPFAPVRSFAQSGYYLLGRDFETPDEVRMLVDAGPLGYLSLAAHGHADALAVLLNVGGREVLIDPGTFAYHTEPVWRRYFRGTAAHNCAVVDGQDQSVQTGNFMWSQHARARCREFTPGPEEQRFAGDHNGYCRYKDPVLHSREIVYDARAGTFMISDTFDCAGAHEIRRRWHFAEDLEIAPLASGVSTQAGRFRVTIVPLEPVAEVLLVRGGNAAQGGWVSRGFGRKEPCPTLTWVSPILGTTTLRTRIVCSPRQ